MHVKGWVCPIGAYVPTLCLPLVFLHHLINRLTQEILTPYKRVGVLTFSLIGANASCPFRET